MAVPEKYREMGEFQDFYLKKKKAPYQTIFIGGNHEASNYLRDLYYGGWACENIYFLGISGVVDIIKEETGAKLTLAGISGIFKYFDYRRPYNETQPYSENDIKSMYHLREFEVEKLKLFASLQNKTSKD